MKRYRIWQRGWWRQNSQRAGWALTICAAGLLVGLGMYIDARSEQADAPEEPALITPALAGEGQNEPELTVDPSIPAPAEPDAPQVEPEESQPTTIEQPAPADQPFAFRSPLSGLVLQRGWGYGYNINTEDYRFHRGVDLEAAAGDSVYAVEAGIAEQVYEDAYWGGVVVINHHNGWRSVYRCLDPLIAPEQQVSAGMLIGRVLEQAPAEAAQSCHLHFELELEGESQDPGAELGI